MSGLGDELRRIAADLVTELVAAETASVLEGLELVQEYSAGNLSSNDLARLDHPYATRHGGPQRDPDVVNRQSGDFFDAWETDGPELRGNRLESSIFNTDPKAAEFLEPGTALMFPRHPHEKAAEQLEPRRLARIEAAIDRALGD